MNKFADGDVVSRRLVQRLSARRSRNSVAIIQNDWSLCILEKTGDQAQFGLFKDGSEAVLLRPEATRYQLLHELKHYEHWLAERGNYADISRLEREEFVFTALKNSHHWHHLNDAEKTHAVQYIRYIRMMHQF